MAEMPESRKTVFTNRLHCGLRQQQTLFHTLIYLTLFKRLFQMSGKALRVKQPGNSTTQKLSR